MAEKDYLNAEEASEELGISRATLYAYVSRGLIRSEAAAGSSRQRRYNRQDVEGLVKRKQQRRDPEKAVEQALHWGSPVLESSLTLISSGQLYYRGLEAIQLASTHSFEQVAMLLWTGTLEAGDPGNLHLPDSLRPALKLTEHLPVIESFQSTLVEASARDPSAYLLQPEAVVQTGWRILALLSQAAVHQEVDWEGRTVANALQESWAADQPGALPLINAALVLCADHELNVSSFTARCVASAGSTPYAAVIAGLAALQGVRHGGAVERVESLFLEVGRPERAAQVLAGRLRRGEPIPGFGHHLYPEGDPRARFLLENIRRSFPDTFAMDLGEAIASHAFHLIGQLPTVDFSLAVLANALKLPPGSALALFALGRTAGWVAHAIEQYQVGQLIRPRARYTGPAANP